MNYKEAEEACCLLRLQAYCHIRRGSCIPSCICLVHSKPIHIKGDQWDLRPPRCIHRDIQHGI